jgi:hypothetical protein
VDTIAQGLNITEACELADVSKQTWYRWRKDGHVQGVVATKFKDMTTGVRNLVADALVPSVRLLVSLAQGKKPTDTDIDGKLAARDVIAAQKQLIVVWKELGGDAESRERDQEKLLEELMSQKQGITQVRIETINTGTQAQPMPVPVGATPVEIVDGEVKEVDGG